MSSRADGRDGTGRSGGEELYGGLYKYTTLRVEKNGIGSEVD